MVPSFGEVPGSGSLVPELLQDLAEEPFHSIPDPGLLSLAVAGHVQRPNLVFQDPRRDVGRLERGGRVDRHARLAQAVTRPDRRPGPRGRSLAEPEGRVGVWTFCSVRAASLSVGSSAAP